MRRSDQKTPEGAMSRFVTIGVLAARAAGWGSTAAAQSSEREVVRRSKALVPSPPWPAGDERGMANAIGPGTWMRCAYFLSQPKAKVYELAHPRSNTMPLSPFSPPYEYKYNPTAVLPGTVHAFDGELLTSGEPAAQGTQLDPLGHFPP